MVALQASIGTLNDLLDAERDAGRIPPKPIPGGQVTVRAARALCDRRGGHRSAAGPAVRWADATRRGRRPGRRIRLRPVREGHGLVVAAVRGRDPAAARVRLDRHRRSDPGLVPVLVLPCAMLAGSALAIANASADLERDEASGTASVAVSLGVDPRRGWSTRRCSRSRPSLVLVIARRRRTAAIARGGRRGPVGRRSSPSGVAWGARSAGAGATVARRQRSWEVQAVGDRRSLACASGCWGAARQPLVRWLSSLRTRAIAFSSLSLVIVRYLARLARSVAGIDSRMSVLRRTSTRPSIASARFCFALTSESSVSGHGLPRGSVGLGGVVRPGVELDLDGLDDDLDLGDVVGLARRPRRPAHRSSRAA